MSAIETERLIAAFELIGVVEGLIKQELVPPYLHDFVRQRAERLRKAYAIAQQQKERSDA